MKLDIGTKIDLPNLLRTRMLLQANSGGGKSYALRKLLEEAFGKVQVIVLDLEGEFGTLREKYDYLLAGKDGDIPVDIRAAEIMARKLLELEASAVIDLYELKSYERILFVKRFLDAMINAPKELWHPCLVVVDEAHVFCPEKGHAESMGAVIDLCTRGRKRGYTAILATQRLSKLHKDAAAECNNKLIGRTGLDVDMKRAAEELGFTKKEDMLSLRALQPGEFYAFGPALSAEIRRIRIDKVKTTHPEAGARSKAMAPPPPTDKIRGMLAKLVDLPKEADKELRTLKDCQDEIRRLKAELRMRPKSAGEKEKPQIDFAGMQQGRERGFKEGYLKAADAYKQVLKDYERRFSKAGSGLKQVENSIAAIRPFLTMVELPIHPKMPETKPKPNPFFAPQKIVLLPNYETASVDTTLSRGERKILIAAAQHNESGGITREQATQLTGYKRSSRDAYISRLQAKEFVAVGHGDGIIRITTQGIEALGHDYEPLPVGDELREYWLPRLPEGEKRVLAELIGAHPDSMDRETVSLRTGYQRSSRDAYISRLLARKLIVLENRQIKASDSLFG